MVVPLWFLGIITKTVGGSNLSKQQYTRPVTRTPVDEQSGAEDARTGTELYRLVNCSQLRYDGEIYDTKVDWIRTALETE
jgi:hypothetical protein